MNVNFNMKIVPLTWKIPKSALITAILNGKSLRITTMSAVQIFPKQTINSQCATTTIQTALTICLNATMTSQTPKMPTPNATPTSLNLRNYTPNATKSTLLPKTVYPPAMLPFRSLKIICSAAKQVTSMLKKILVISNTHSQSAMPISTHANKTWKAAKTMKKSM